MQKFKKILLNGLKEAKGIKEDDRVAISEYLEKDMLEKVEELETRLGLQLYQYDIKVEYEGDVPQKFIHTLMVNFESLDQQSGVLAMSFPGAMKQIKEILSTGDDEVLVAALNVGLKIQVIA